MTKINTQPEIDLDTVVPLAIKPPAVCVSDLIDLVNFAYEENVASYWEIKIKDVQKAELTIGGLTHNYTYKFTIIDYSESEDGIDHVVNVETIKLGIERLLTGETKVSRYVMDQLKDAIYGYTMDIDSDVLDCILQAGIFGDIVYG